VYSIAVTVADNRFGSDSESVDLTVDNVAPDVLVSGPSSGVRGQALAFSGSFTDVGTLDTHAVSWDFGDGTVIADLLIPPSHVYTTNGVYTVTLSVRDDDGGLTSVNKTVTITSVALQDDPCDPEKTALVVGGTTENDVIDFTPLGNLGDIEVFINGISEGVFRPTGHIIAYGQSGDDDIEVGASITLEAWLYGDAGNDRLKGAAGASILLGGDGDDELLGGLGRGILIGGRGEDRLRGGSGEDILIGGSTAYDALIQPLCTITDIWNSTIEPYEVRIGRLRLLLNPYSVIDDGEADLLTGTSGLDWFFAGVADFLTDDHDDETVG
jgi:Ca2+-binding RTX toxin-like protein